VVCPSQTLTEKSESLLMLIGGYFDESSDEGIENRCYSVCGYVADGASALELSFIWADLLRKHHLAYFKASEIEYGFGEFRQYRDNPDDLAAPLSKKEKEKIVEIKTDFVSAICKCNVYGVGTVLMLRDYELLLSENMLAQKNLAAPWYLCSSFTLMASGLLMNEANRRHPPDRSGYLRPIFDWQKEYKGKFIESFPNFCRKNPESSRSLLPPHFEMEQDYKCLQAADCLAYEARKLLFWVEYEENPNRPMRKAMQRLGDRLFKIYKLNYEGLKIIAENQTADRIPIAPALETKMDLQI
jgi:hypothetical protein